MVVRGRQLFALPPTWAGIDLAAVPELRNPLLEEAYRRFFTTTFDNLEACFEGREFRIGRPPMDPTEPLLTQALDLVLGAVTDWLGDRPAGGPGREPQAGAAARRVRGRRRRRASATSGARGEGRRHRSDRAWSAARSWRRPSPPGTRSLAITRPGPERRGDAGAVGGSTRADRDRGPHRPGRPAPRRCSGCDAVVHCAAVYAFGAARAAEVEPGQHRRHPRGPRGGRRSRGVPRRRHLVVGHPRVEPAPPGPVRARPASATEPAPAYYASKVAQEEVALETGRRRGLAVVLALPTVVLGGPFTRLARATPSSCATCSTRPAAPSPAAATSSTPATSAPATSALLERGVAGERYLLGGEDLSWRMLHTLVSDLAGLPGPFAEMAAGNAWAVVRRDRVVGAAARRDAADHARGGHHGRPVLLVHLGQGRTSSGMPRGRPARPSPPRWRGWR